MPRVLLLMPTTTYRAEAFLEAARRLAVDVTVASERPNTLARLNPAGLLTLDFQRPERAAQQAVKFAGRYGCDAVVPVDSQVVPVAAHISQALGLPYNSVESVRAAENKYYMRQLLEQAGVPVPRFQLGSLPGDRAALAQKIDYPCVVKPLSLAGSQGVIRADDASDFLRAVDRLEKILTGQQESQQESQSGTCQSGERTCQQLAEGVEFLVEQFVGGPEVALEGLLDHGRLRLLAVFDKPDPLEGPFFEETIYVTPSQLSAETQQTFARCAERAARALGLTTGPVHAELRWSSDGPCVIELNARSIGGLCSRVLRFGTGWSLEELILRQALEKDFQPPQRESQAAGVMMIPIPRAGRLGAVGGVDEAKAGPHIEDLVLSAHLGQQLAPLPEGSQYLGFIFARGGSPRVVEAALRNAHAQLEFVIE